MPATLLVFYLFFLYFSVGPSHPALWLGTRQPNLLATKRKNGKNFLGLQELRGKRELQILHTKNKNGKQFRRKILWLTSITFCILLYILFETSFLVNRWMWKVTTRNMKRMLVRNYTSMYIVRESSRGSPISSIHVYDEYTTNRTLASETTNNDLRWIFLESKRKPGLRHLGKFDTEWKILARLTYLPKRNFVREFYVLYRAAWKNVYQKK